MIASSTARAQGTHSNLFPCLFIYSSFSSSSSSSSSSFSCSCSFFLWDLFLLLLLVGATPRLVWSCSNHVTWWTDWWKLMDHCRRRHGSRQLFLRFLQHRETNFICFPLSNPLPPLSLYRWPACWLRFFTARGCSRFFRNSLRIGSDSRRFSEIPRDSWRFLEILGDSWRFLMILGNFQRFLKILGEYSCRFFEILADSLRFLNIPKDSCRFLQILADSLRFFEILNDSRRWFLEISRDSWRFLGNILADS